MGYKFRKRCRETTRSCHSEEPQHHHAPCYTYIVSDHNIPSDMSMLTNSTGRQSRKYGQQRRLTTLVEDLRPLISHRKANNLTTQVQAIRSSVVSLRGLGENIIAHVRRLPKKMRELLQAILYSNWQIYQILLQIQRTTSQSPTGLLDSNIKFEDALGEYKELPYEHFRHWEVGITCILVAIR